MGFPTINLKIPEIFELKTGIYAAIVSIENKIFSGALHYGPVPTFNEGEKSLEVFLLLSNNNKLKNLFDNKIIQVETVKYLRKIIKFNSKEELIKQINEDVRQIIKLT